MKSKHKKKNSINIKVEISPGELLDKITILEIKKNNTLDSVKLKNINYELSILAKTRDKFIPIGSSLKALISKLKKCNTDLWKILDESAVLERKSDFGKRYLELAKAVVKKNNERYELKRAINSSLESRIFEEKVYPS